MNKYLLSFFITVIQVSIFIKLYDFITMNNDNEEEFIIFILYSLFFYPFWLLVFTWIL